MTTLTIELPWPAKELWPNRNLGRGWKYRQSDKVAAKQMAYALTLQTGGMAWETTGERVPVSWTFCPPTRRRYDAQGVYGACKAYEDGMAQALGIDDSNFWPVVLRPGKVTKGGCVIVEIEP